ncbi:MAG: CRISPR-associated endonuclease Cas2 [Nanoarchaeota archaeon]
MYVIVVYDVDEKRVKNYHKLLRQYLHWRQRSVFEGYITKNKLKELKEKLFSLLEKDDYVIIFETKSKENIKIEELTLKEEIPFII